MPIRLIGGGRVILALRIDRGRVSDPVPTYSELCEMLEPIQRTEISELATQAMHSEPSQRYSLCHGMEPDGWEAEWPLS